MKILVAGCGYLGKNLGGRLAADGHEVWGLRRSLEGLKDVERAGLRLIRADLGDPASLEGLPDFDSIVLCQAPSRNTDTYRSTYAEGTRNLLAAVGPRQGRKTLLVSSTSVYAEASGGWVDETTPVDRGAGGPARARQDAQSLLEAESLVLAWPTRGCVLRLAGLYGPGRNRLKRLKEGRLEPDFTGTYTNRVHVDDAAAAARLVLERGVPGEIYIAADDAPSTQREFYEFLCPRLGLESPAGPSGAAAEASAGKRCSNRKIRELGFTPRYPSFREGYEPLLREIA